jgi:hypothetical protein
MLSVRSQMPFSVFKYQILLMVLMQRHGISELATHRTCTKVTILCVTKLFNCQYTHQHTPANACGMRFWMFKNVEIVPSELADLISN